MILLLTFFIWLAILFVASSIRTSFRQVSGVRNTQGKKCNKNKYKKNLYLSQVYWSMSIFVGHLSIFVPTHTRHTKRCTQRTGCRKNGVKNHWIFYLTDETTFFFIIFVVSCFFLCSIFMQVSHVLFLFLINVFFSSVTAVWLYQ